MLSGRKKLSRERERVGESEGECERWRESKRSTKALSQHIAKAIFQSNASWQ